LTQEFIGCAPRDLTRPEARANVPSERRQGFHESAAKGKLSEVSTASRQQEFSQAAASASKTTTRFSLRTRTPGVLVQVDPSNMDEIIALQAALAHAQNAKSSIRLSERNIVELVNKLKSLDLLDASLLYTLNGKEYVTEARLDGEIKDEVQRKGGRVPVTDLQTSLNVDVVHCERRARALAEDPSNRISLVEGELITPEYFDAVAAEVDEELRESGVIGLGELARRHGLSADLMTRALRERVGHVDRDAIVNGRLEGGSIYTEEYVRRLRAQLRGAMRAALVPTTRDRLVTNALRSVDRNDVADAALTGSILGDLAKGTVFGGDDTKREKTNGVYERVADGVLRGGAWHPAVYSRAQLAAVREVYVRAGLVTHEQATRMGVDDPERYFKVLDPNHAALPESYASYALVERFEAAVRDALMENDGWCEVDALLPADLPAGDARALLAATQVVRGSDAAEKRRGEKAEKRKGGGEKIVSSPTARAVESRGGVFLVGCATPAFFDRARAVAVELGTARGREEGARRRLAKRDGSSSVSTKPETSAVSAAAASSRDGKQRRESRDDRTATAGSSEDVSFASSVRAEALESEETRALGDGARLKRGKRGKLPSKRSKREKNERSTKGFGGGPGATIESDPFFSANAEEDERGSLTISELRDAFRSLAAGASDDFLEAVAAESFDFAAAAFSAAVAETFESEDATAKHAARSFRAAAAKAFDEAFPSAYAFARGAELLRDDSDAQKHCCEAHAVPVADAFLVSRTEADLDVLFPELLARFLSLGESFAFREDSVLTESQRERAASSFPAPARLAALDVAAAASASCDPSAVARAIARAMEAVSGDGKRARGTDRNTERAFVRARARTLQTRFDAFFRDSTGGSNDPDDVQTSTRDASRQLLDETSGTVSSMFSVAVPLLLAAARGRAVALTGRSFGTALKGFQEGGFARGALPAVDAAFLAAFHEDLLTALADGGGGSGVEDARLASLASRVGELRRIVSVCAKARGPDEADEEA